MERWRGRMCEAPPGLTLPQGGVEAYKGGGGDSTAPHCRGGDFSACNRTLQECHCSHYPAHCLHNSTLFARCKVAMCNVFSLVCKGSVCLCAMRGVS